MPSIRIGIAQINVTVGDLAANAEHIIDSARRMQAAGANVILFPELCLSGYPPEDLILKQHFVEDCEKQVARLAEELPEEVISILGTPTAGTRKPRNSAVIIADHRQAATYSKALLPNYGVFDEQRVFEPGQQTICLQIGATRLGIHICEDSWMPQALPVMEQSHLQLHALLNLSASPFHKNKWRQREEILGATAKALGCHLIYTNLVGGQDELVFDGSSMVISPQEEILMRARAFEEDELYFDLPVTDTSALLDQPDETGVEWIFMEGKFPEVEKQPVRIEPVKDDLDEVYAALKLGLRDYVNKNGFKKAVIAISGGIDSALVAALAVDALGADRVEGLTMPSQYSSEETLGDAGKLAENLGIPMHTLPIRKLFDSYLEELDPVWEGTEPGLAEENIQARIRGNLVMAMSNKFGWIVLTTGNKSELATGYCTLYGDMAGGFAVIKDVPKVMVFDLCRWRNQQGNSELIPDSIITRPPSAELRADQKDTDSLPPYEELDPILECYVEKDMGVDAIIAEGFEAETVRRIVRLVDLNEYKRRQAPPGVRITPKAFGRDRRMPITNRYRN